MNLDIQAFSGSGITDYNTGLTNTVIDSNGKATQRASINVTEDGVTFGVLARGRGIYYWEANTNLYIENDNDLFEATQNSTRIAEVSGTFSTGTERCTLLETLGATPLLVILDAENNKGWTLTKLLALNPIASNFPTTLVHGGAILDSYLFVIYPSFVLSQQVKIE